MTAPAAVEGKTMMAVVGIRFHRAGRIHYYDPGAHALESDDLVIVETHRGLDVGRVVIAPRQVVLNGTDGPLKPVMRRAQAPDIRQMDFFKTREADALERCKVRVAAHGLPMKLVGAEYNFDGSRLTFQFVAEGRVDFRALVRDLASTFRTRIELRQIGTRDQAKLVGGMGRCGREICCAAWLHDLPSTSIRMAKDQDLPVNPTRITGSCGRLLCCLSYEYDEYSAMKRRMPRLGQTVTVPAGTGRVVALHPLEGVYDVQLAGGDVAQVPVEVGNGQPSPSCATCSHRPGEGHGDAASACPAFVGAAEAGLG